MLLYLYERIFICLNLISIIHLFASLTMLNFEERKRKYLNTTNGVFIHSIHSTIYITIATWRKCHTLACLYLPYRSAENFVENR